MPKYYVKSGELKEIVDGEVTAREAILIAVRRSLDGQCLDVDGSFYVDERGFRGPDPDETIEEWVLRQLSHKGISEGLPEYEFSVDKVFGDDAYREEEEEEDFPF